MPLAKKKKKGGKQKQKRKRKSKAKVAKKPWIGAGTKGQSAAAASSALRPKEKLKGATFYDMLCGAGKTAERELKASGDGSEPRNVVVHKSAGNGAKFTIRQDEATADRAENDATPGQYKVISAWYDPSVKQYLIDYFELTEKVHDAPSFISLHPDHETQTFDARSVLEWMNINLSNYASSSDSDSDSDNFLDDSDSESDYRYD